MLDPISSADVGHTIPRGIDHGTAAPALMPWPDEVSIQGGKSGIVFVRAPGPGEPTAYQTAFVEVFVGGTFIRGEGKTVTEAEAAAWEKYQTWLHCPGPTGEHSYRPGYTGKDGTWVRYTNGAGFCEHCRAFKARTFIAEQLGQFCSVCGVPTMNGVSSNAEGVKTFLCEEHNRETVQVTLPAVLARFVTPAEIIKAVEGFTSTGRGEIGKVLEETGWVDDGARVGFCLEASMELVSVEVSLRYGDVLSLRFDAGWLNASESDAVRAIVTRTFGPLLSLADGPPSGRRSTAALLENTQADSINNITRSPDVRQ